MPDIETIDDIIAAFHAGKIYCGPEVVALIAEVERLRGDERRIDWLADVDNKVGNVMLPPEVVLSNIDDMRAAIDEAMHYEPHPTEPGMYRRKENKNA